MKFTKFLATFLCLTVMADAITKGPDFTSEDALIAYAKSQDHRFTKYFFYKNISKDSLIGKRVPIEQKGKINNSTWYLKRIPKGYAGEDRLILEIWD